jgi:hypothetical protein
VGDCGLNSGSHTFKAGALPLESLCQPRSRGLNFNLLQKSFSPALPYTKTSIFHCQDPSVLGRGIDTRTGVIALIRKSSKMMFSSSIHWERVGLMNSVGGCMWWKY